MVSGGPTTPDMSAFFRAGTERQAMFNQQEAAATQAAIAGTQALSGAAGEVGRQRTARRGQDLQAAATKESVDIERERTEIDRARGQFIQNQYKNEMALKYNVAPDLIERLSAESTTPEEAGAILRIMQDGKHLMESDDLQASLKLIRMHSLAMDKIEGEVSAQKVNRLVEVLTPQLKAAGRTMEEIRKMIAFEVYATGKAALVSDYELSKMQRENERDEAVQEYAVKALGFDAQSKAHQAETLFNLRDEMRETTISTVRHDRMSAKLKADTLRQNLSKLAHLKGLEVDNLVSGAEQAFFVHKFLSNPSVMKKYAESRVREMLEKWDAEKAKTLLPIAQHVLAQKNASMAANLNTIASNLEKVNNDINKLGPKAAQEESRDHKYAGRQGPRQARDQLEKLREQQTTYLEQLRKVNLYNTGYDNIVTEIGEAIGNGTLTDLVVKYNGQPEWFPVALRAYEAQAGKPFSQEGTPSPEEGKTVGGPSKRQKEQAEAESNPRTDKQVEKDIDDIAEGVLEGSRNAR